ncbi:hydrolase [Mycobacterium phage Pharaoh]|uniref:Hydrolase n=1 Tax=Mycobacterium phage Pharaoh TaxID=2530140 RepID=A0A481W3A0_9CAUD|nr:virion structural protein [Mycobacterium phage Pharaoh]QBJ00198.1 hydrolase [Mycobacterium phage Pharaoh]
MATRLLGTTRPDFRLGSVKPSRLYLGSNLFWGSMFADEFPTDSAGIPGWTKANGIDARVVQGRAAAAGIGMNSSGTAVYRPPVVMPQDDIAIRFRVNGPVTAAATDNAAEVWVRCEDSTAINYAVQVRCFQGPNRLLIATRINGAATDRTTSVAYPFDVDLEFLAIGRTFTVTRLDTKEVLCTWVDSTNLTAMGSSYRGLKAALQTNYPIFQQQYSSPSLDRFEVLLP